MGETFRADSEGDCLAREAIAVSGDCQLRLMWPLPERLALITIIEFFTGPLLGV
jgi:hypothetical protein